MQSNIQPSLSGNWDLGTVPVDVLATLTRHTRHTVSRLWHALYDSPLSSDERQQLRRHVGDLQVIANLVRPQLPPCPAPGAETDPPDAVVTNQWREAGPLTDAVRSLSAAVHKLAAATDGLLAHGPVPTPPTPTHARQTIPASAYQRHIAARDQSMQRLLQDIEIAMNTIYTFGRRIHYAGLQRMVVRQPVARPAPVKPTYKLTFLGTKATTAQRSQAPVS